MTNAFAADQLFDEMLQPSWQHFDEDSEPIFNQKCAGLALKLKVNKIDESEAFYQACKMGSEHTFSNGKPNAKWEKLLDDYKNARGDGL